MMKIEIENRLQLIKVGKEPVGYKNNNGYIIPKDWKIEKMGNLMEFKNGLNYKSNDSGELIKIVGVGDFKDNFYLNPKIIDYINVNNLSNDYLLKDGDLLFVRSNGNKDLIGRVLYCNTNNEKMTFSGFTIRGRLHSNDMMDKYCAYYCSSNLVKSQYMKNGGGTNINNLSQGILSNLDITKPPLNEQKRIVETIEVWDKLIYLKEKLLEQKLKQKKGLMERLLTGKVRLSGFNNEWHKVKISEVFDIRNEKSTITDELELYSLTIENGVTEKSDRYNREFLVKGDNKKYKITKFNDIVYNPANLRFGAISLNKIKKDVLLSPIYETLYVKNIYKYDVGFISQILMSENQIKHFSTMAERTLVERMSVKVKDFINFKINIPNSIHEQKAIAQIIYSCEKEIELLKKEITLLKKQKDGLIKLMLTGVVRVNYSSNE